MWRGPTEESGASPPRPPADAAALHRLERSLGHPLPPDLSALLLETDGIEGPYGEGVVWPVERILKDNGTFRTDPDLRSLYRPFELLLFFGDNGGGDQFAFARPPGRVGVYVWDHETDERHLVAADLTDYVRRALRSEGEDWYR